MGLGERRGAKRGQGASNKSLVDKLVADYNFQVLGALEGS